MLYSHGKDLAEKYAKQVEEKLVQYNLAATPNNYELWYNYVAGEHADVVNDINMLLKDNNEITEPQCAEIFERYLSDNKTEKDHVRRAGNELQTTINSVKEVMANVQASTHHYNTTLSEFNQQLQGELSQDDVKKIVVSAQENTEKVIENNQALEQALDSSEKEIERLRTSLEEVKKESLTDGLTGLANRKSFDNEIRRVLEQAKADNETFSLLILDIDHFKSFNDNYGHQVGDQVLRLVAKCLTDGVKGKDIPARYGGEEFVIILPETSLAGAVAAGNNLRLIVANKDVVNKNSGSKMGRITMSVGVAEFSGDESVEDLIERADSALYTAKHNGRNQVAAAPTPKK